MKTITLSLAMVATSFTLAFAQASEAQITQLQSEINAAQIDVQVPEGVTEEQIAQVMGLLESSQDTDYLTNEVKKVLGLE